MCGIVGIFGQLNRSITSDTMTRMLCKIRHRGPDNQDFWFDEHIALGHQRLSILDLSKFGNQPMHSKSKRYVIIFNGEIYNHLELRSLLHNYDWKSSSDTETLLSCIEKWGIQRTLYKIRGMFAFALWDKKDKLLYLARDRAGEKPCIMDL